MGPLNCVGVAIEGTGGLRSGDGEGGNKHESVGTTLVGLGGWEEGGDVDGGEADGMVRDPFDCAALRSG